jgi:hypothetical protein
MKSIVISIAALVLLSAAALAGELVSVSGASKVALDGYDPVAFFHPCPVRGLLKTSYRQVARRFVAGRLLARCLI